MVASFAPSSRAYEEADPKPISHYTARQAGSLQRISIPMRMSPAPSSRTEIEPTVVFDTFWWFAAERLAMYYRRLAGSSPPWTTDSILSTYRFTNTYRITDRVTQYLVREIQYHPNRSQTPQELFFRTLIFKIFNKIETWEAIERKHGPLMWASVDMNGVDQTLSELLSNGSRIYSAAYIMPSPRFGSLRKHTNHLKLIETMMNDRLSERLQQAPDLGTVYEALACYPGLGRFLSFQFTIDLNYSNLFDFSETYFVISGPGAIDGISKCFESVSGMSPEEVIYWVTDRQEQEMAKRGIQFPGLFGRPLQPIDCQNLFCEVSKYARVKHPHFSGRTKRHRIKQSFRRNDRPIPAPFFPPRWGLRVPISLSNEELKSERDQLPLF